MCCPRAFTASVIMDYSPTPSARSTSPPLASFCISRRRNLSQSRALAAPIMVPTGPPSCADTAALRCSSSRPSLALSTSADRQSRSRHDQQRFNRRDFAGDIYPNHAVANTRRLVRKTPPGPTPRPPLPPRPCRPLPPPSTPPAQAPATILAAPLVADP